MYYIECRFTILLVLTSSENRLIGERRGSAFSGLVPGPKLIRFDHATRSECRPMATVERLPNCDHGLWRHNQQNHVSPTVEARAALRFGDN